jgi:hypothetical protein
VAASCADAGTSGCVVSVAGSTPGGLFGWSPSDNAESTLLDGGWKLQPGDPCAVTQSSLDLSSIVPTDLYGTPRSTTPSLGADEFDGGCTPSDGG